MSRKSRKHKAKNTPKKLPVKHKGASAASSVKPQPKKKGSKGGYSTTRCYESHPAIDIGGYKVYGGSCSSPVHKDADVYVGLDSYSFQYQTRPAFPWQKQTKTSAVEFLFAITDMSVPKEPKLFKELIVWLADQIVEGKKVHIGCIGGHGRTGMVLSALVAYMTTEEDQIGYVRKHYCKKAVETTGQVEYLHKHFGCKKIEGSKESLYGGKQPGFWGHGDSYYGSYGSKSSSWHDYGKKKAKKGKPLEKAQVGTSQPKPQIKHNVLELESAKCMKTGNKDIWNGESGAFLYPDKS